MQHDQTDRASGRRTLTLDRRRVHLVVLGLLALLIVVMASPAGVQAAARDNADPLRITRQLYRLELRAAGATIRSLPVSELQQAHNDCALAIVARLYRDRGRRAPAPAALTVLFDLEPRGVRLQQLAAGLNALGWSATVQRPERPASSAPEASVALRAPGIALLRLGHYVLLTRRTVSHVEYFDPLIGQVREPLPHFAARWTGKGVQLSTRDD